MVLVNAMLANLQSEIIVARISPQLLLYLVSVDPKCAVNARRAQDDWVTVISVMMATTIIILPPNTLFSRANAN